MTAAGQSVLVYVRDGVDENVKATYQLTVTQAEKAKLTEMLETCPS